jgi:hypothetical protein
MEKKKEKPEAKDIIGVVVFVGIVIALGYWLKKSK